MMTNGNKMTQETRSPHDASHHEKVWSYPKKEKKYGLIWEQKHPGYERLWNQKITVGCSVHILPPRYQSTVGSDTSVWTVTEIDDENNAHLIHYNGTKTPDQKTVSMNDDVLVKVADLESIQKSALILDEEITHSHADDVHHAVINAENLRALQMMEKTHTGKIDAIYIDPPYNTGAKEWKYNNDYVDSADEYRHSKWLSFMDERLRLAKKLMNKDNSVLILTIDEKEYLRTGMLLEEIFPEARIQMVSSVINPKGTGRRGSFSRVNEYVFFVMMGDAVPVLQSENTGEEIKWQTLRRTNPNNTRDKSSNQFYPIYVDKRTLKIIGRGDVLPQDKSRHDVTHPDENIDVVFPVRDNGTEMMWGLKDTTFDWMLAEGYVRLSGKRMSKPQQYVLKYLMTGTVRGIEDGRVSIERNGDGEIVSGEWISHRDIIPFNQWDIASHNAEMSGTLLLKQIIGEKRFDYPKSLYAVEDALRLFIKGNKNAVVLDFFGGSGTTAHAVMRLNAEDGGARQAIVISNNEVSDDEDKKFTAQGLRPSDEEYIKHGICEYVTKPRIKAAVTGKTVVSGFTEDIVGQYRYNQVYPLADGLRANVRFFTLIPWGKEDAREQGVHSQDVWVSIDEKEVNADGV